ncbi:MAG: hypothetical protein DRP63_01715 [Planctomycetota bacterium]|nr:MAG: hypothetical protein DRP63_01715 [Planctomycetota bacterium]
MQYELAVTVDDPFGNGSVMRTPGSADGWYNANTEVTLLASPSEDFRQWLGDVTESDPQISVVMDSAKDITAIFNKFKLTVTTDPSAINPTVLNPRKGDNWLEGGSTTCRASLHVSISEGARYRLVSYSGTGSVPSGAVPFSATTDPYQVTFSLDRDSSIAWKWERFYRVTASVSLPAGGSIIWNIPAGTQYYTDNGERWFKEGSGISLTAKANTYYHFVEWQENGRTISTNTTLNLPNINSAHRLVAVFARDQYTLYVRCKVDGNEVGPPSDGIDSPKPAYGDHECDAGPPPVHATIDSSTVTNDGTRWIFQGWEVKVGDNITTGITDYVDITLTTDTFLYWRWKSQYRLKLTVTSGGSVDVTVDGGTTTYKEGTHDLWFEKGTEVTLKANSGSIPFTCWEGDYPSGKRTSKEITITMDDAKTLKAVFGVRQCWWWSSWWGTDGLAYLWNTEITRDRWGNICLQLARQIIGSWDSQAQCKFGKTFKRFVDLDRPVAQTFVPSRSGYLDKVQSYVGPDPVHKYWGYLWTLGFVEIKEGGPDGRKLAESHLTWFYVGNSHWQTFNIKNPPYVRAGRTYTIVWRGGRTVWWDGAYVYWFFDAYGEEGDPYKDGAAYHQDFPWWPWQLDKNGRDYYFRVHIGGQWDPNAALGRMVEDWYSWVDVNHVAQTFTPSKSGKITKVKAYIRGGGPEGPPDAYVEIREGGPRGPLLGTSEIVGTPWDPDWVEFSFPFSSAPFVEAGKTYAIVFRFHWSGPYDEPPPETSYTVYGRQYNPYKGGAGYYGWGGNWWRFPDDRDLMFQVFVESEDSRKYYKYGGAMTVEIPESGKAVAWARVWLGAFVWWPNISLKIYVLDAAWRWPWILKEYTVRSGFFDIIDLSDIDASKYPKLRLYAYFTSEDRNETPELFFLSVIYYAEPAGE